MEKLLYAIVKTDNSGDSGTELLSGIEALSGTTVYLITREKIAAVVSDFNTGGKVADKAAVLLYAGIIEELSKRTVLLPVRFGTMFRSDEMIIRLLHRHYDHFCRTLDSVESKDEYGLKILWDYERGLEKIKLKTESEQPDEGNYFGRQTIYTGYLFEKIKQHRIEEAILKEAEEIIGHISERLTMVASQSIFKKMVSGKILLEGDFLVDRSRKEEFISVMELVRQQHPGVHFLMTGPWPPYSFTGTISTETDFP